MKKKELKWKCRYKVLKERSETRAKELSNALRLCNRMVGERDSIIEALVAEKALIAEQRRVKK